MRFRFFRAIRRIDAANEKFPSMNGNVDNIMWHFPSVSISTPKQFITMAKILIIFKY
jgi:hypothetical protein